MDQQQELVVLTHFLSTLSKGALDVSDARALLERFGSLSGMASFPPEILMQVGRLSAAQAERLMQETCVAELVHDILAILTFGCVWIWPGWGLWLSIAYVLIGHLPYIVIQRYNRPRLARMHALLKAREERAKQK